MLKVKCRFSVETNWKEDLAIQLNGKIQGNFVEIPPCMYQGINYLLEVDSNFSVWFSNGKYYKTISIQSLENTQPDFFFLIFCSGIGTITLLNNNKNHKWNYGFVLLDSADKNHFVIEAGSENCVLAIFVKKKALNQLFETHTADPSQKYKLENTLAKFGRANPRAWNVLNEIRHLSPVSVSFDYFLTGAMYALLGIIFDEITNQDRSFADLEDADITRILLTQELIIQRLDKNFPGIKMLASMAYMSESKFKHLFRKITGFSPNNFFIKNKLELSRKIMELENSSIAEIAKRMNYSSHSYFSEQFKKHFGLLPKEYRANLFPHYPQIGENPKYIDD
ncbi:helix-turn-helix domain-containing protein [Sphingobacterium spiritivorum]|uniref:helix-turn-helix domain-containing protein n=1 Tax=Sphingobacterium spiritivorum TaxID=258 RepID=UPI0019195BC9|nr:AraC family transcriptional regulator [Sphingobacterium spiritivorum]QQT24259.1 helix-turn-helix transcriptional regulator [Sphingobacterium spiritivorum]